MKRISILFFVFFLILSFNVIVESKTTEITIWTSHGSEYNRVNKIAERYKEKTGVKINIERIYELNQIERLSLDGRRDKGADIVGFAHDNLLKAKNMGLITPIEDYIELEYVNENFIEDALNPLTINGKLYGIPYSYESAALIYNKDLISEIPETFEEMLDIAEELTFDDQYGFFYSHGIYSSFPIISSFGGYIFGKDEFGNYNPKDLGFGKKEFIEASEYIETFRERGLITTSRTSKAGDLFKEGKLAITINGPWAINEFLDSGINVGVTTIPKLPNGYAKTLVGTKGYYVSNFSEEKQASVDFIKFMTNEEMSMERFSEDNIIVPHKSVMNSQKLADHKYMGGFLEQASTGVSMPALQEMSVVWNFADNALGFLLEGRSTSKVVWDIVLRQVENEIWKMN